MNRPIKNDRWILFAFTALVLFCVTVVTLAREMWPVVLYRLLTDGGIAILWLLATAGIGRAILKLARIFCESKALMFVTSSALGLGVLSILILLLGLAGLLNHAVAIGLIAGGLIVGATTLSDFKFQICDFKSSHWLWLILVPIAALMIVAAFVPPGVLWGDEPHGYDVLEYHLQVPREWYEAGRIVPLTHNVFSYFPFNVEMHYLLAMHLRGGPWAGMYLAQLMHGVFIALTIVALRGFVKPQAAMVAAAVPWMAMLAPVAYNEGGLLLFGTLAVVWMLRSDGKLKHIIFAGAMAGFACGAKLTAVPLILLAIPLSYFSLSLWERVGVRGRAESDGSQIRTPPHPNPLPKGEGTRGVIVFIVAGLVTFSPWVVRNIVWTGNPVFPEATSLFGQAHFSEIQIDRWQREHSPTINQKPVISRHIAARDQIILNWRYGFVLFALAVVAAALNRSRQAMFVVTLLLIQLIFWIGFTHLQGRFYIIAIPLAVLLFPEKWKYALIVTAIVNVSITMYVLAPRVMRFSDGLGAENLQALLPESINSVLNQNRPIALAGDARAFLYQVPMSRLTYRTVFDVDAGESAINAWIKGSPDDAVVIIEPRELERLSSTYWNIPPLLNPFEDPTLKGRAWITFP